MEKNLEILTILQEECAELIVAISKIKRFGITEDNMERLNQEIADVICMLNLANTAGLVELDNLDLKIKAKETKLKKYSKVYDDAPFKT